MTVLPSPAKSVMAAAPLCPNKLGLEGTLQAQLRGPSPLLTGPQFGVEISVILSSLLKISGNFNYYDICHFSRFLHLGRFTIPPRIHVHNPKSSHLSHKGFFRFSNFGGGGSSLEAAHFGLKFGA